MFKASRGERYHINSDMSRQNGCINVDKVDSKFAAMTLSSSATTLCDQTCWEEATQRLSVEDPKTHKRLLEMLASQTQPRTRAEMSDQIAAMVEINRSRMSDGDLPLSLKDGSQGERAKVRRALDRILKAALLFDQLGPVANLEPHVGIAWTGINIILQIALSNCVQNAAALKGLGEISSVVTRYAKIEEIYFERTQRTSDTKLDKEFRALVVDLYVKILIYQVSIASHCKRSRIVQHARAIPKLDDWSGLLEDILRDDAQCMKFIEVFDSEVWRARHQELKDTLAEQERRVEEASQNLVRIHEQNHRLIDRSDHEANIAILDWISKAPPGEDHAHILESGKLDREYANSGQWLFNRTEYAVWRDFEQNGPSVVWLCGPVGTGKSSLVCLVIEHSLKKSASYKLPKERLAYFYCSKKQGLKDGSSPKTVLQSLVRQLAWSTDDLSIAPTVKKRYQDSHKLQGYGQNELLTNDCIDLLVQLIASHQQTTIAIDALDECSDHYTLLSALERVSVLCKGRVKVLLSSRMHVPVNHTFPQCHQIQVGLDSTEDIEFYIRTEVDANKARLAQCKATDLKDPLIETLSRRAQGMFRWVELQLDTFFNSRTKLRRRDAVQRKLDKLGQEDGTPALGPVYDEIYEMNMQEPEDRTVASRALKWMLCSQRPLSIYELVEAASVSPEGAIEEDIDEDYILDICSNFIITDNLDFVQFSHLSVREYLVQGRGTEYSNNAAHIQAAETCLAFLIRGDFDAGMDFGKGGGLSGYVALYWLVHCAWKLDKGQRADTLQRLSNTFLSIRTVHPSFAKWTTVLPDALRKLYSDENYFWEDILEHSVSSPPNPLFIACVCGFEEIVRNALSTGQSPEQRNSTGDTALLLASHYGHLEVAKILLDHGADVDACNYRGYAPIHYALRPSVQLSAPRYWNPINPEIAWLLIERKADVTKTIKGDINNGWTALHFVACYDTDEMVEVLLDHGADLNARESDDHTPLHVAATTGSTATLQQLLEKGADLEAKTNEGETAIHQAAQCGKEDAVNLIVAHSGLESIVGSQWLRQAQFRNAVNRGDEAAVRALLDDGADMTTRDIRGETPLHWAVDCGHRAVALLLLERGADIEARDRFGGTALHMACLKANEEMAGFLLDQGANIDAKGSDQAALTPVSVAVDLGRPAMVQFLLDRGASPQDVPVDLVPSWLGVETEGFEAALALVQAALRRT